MILTFELAPAVASPPDWPPFVPPRDSLAAGVAASIETAWRQPTLTRTVEGRSASVPLDVYDAFIDAPDVTAAAARHLKLAEYQVRALDDDWYQADDGRGARGIYHVVVRERARRVIVSWGSHSGAILGTVTGSALTVLDFIDRGGTVAQKITVYVHMDSVILAALARTLLPVFGWLMDRKLTDGFRVTAAVAEWAVSRSDEFCAWIRGQTPSTERARQLLAAVGGCARSTRDLHRQEPRDCDRMEEGTGTRSSRWATTASSGRRVDRPPRRQPRDCASGGAARQS